MWREKIKLVLGSFWYNLWQDSWLVSNICNLFQLVIGNTTQTSVEFAKQQSFIQLTSQSPICPRRSSLLLSSTIRTGISDFQDIILASDSQSATAVYYSDSSCLFIDSVQQTSDLLYPTLDCSQSSGMSWLTKVDQTTYSFPVQKLEELKKLKPVYKYYSSGSQVCYRAWKQQTIQNKLVQDHFTSILGLSNVWSSKYLQIVRLLWNAYINGLTKQTLISCLDLSGTQYELITSVSDSAQLAIPVITSVGVMQANNYSASCPGYIPLTGTHRAEYISKCLADNDNKYIPYMQLTGTMKPASFLVNQLWRGRCYILKIQSSQLEAKLLDQLLQAFSKMFPSNIIFIVQHQSNIQVPLQLNIQQTQAILNYYKDSINNNYQLEIK